MATNCADRRFGLGSKQLIYHRMDGWFLVSLAKNIIFFNRFENIRHGVLKIAIAAGAKRTVRIISSELISMRNAN